MMNRDDAAMAIRNADLGELGGTILQELKPSVLINAERGSLDELPIGASRIGGVPDLPAGFQWPRWSGSKMVFDPPVFTKHRSVPFQEKELHFIAQLNLENLSYSSAGSDLPSQGVLYFFYDLDVQPWGFDPAHHLGSRVIFVENAAVSLTRHRSANADPNAASFPCAVTFADDWTIPDGEALGIGYGNDLAIFEVIDELKQDLIGTSDEQPYKPIHRLFGWPEPVQGDMKLECQLVANGIYCGDGSAYNSRRAKALEAGAQDWLLLLQIDTDEAGPGWMWGDCGRIYYWIRKCDLKQRRFEHARLILQCS